MEDNIPRRVRMDLWTPAELAIYNAMQEVEKAGAHVLLTNAVCLLSEAQDAVSDYVDLLNSTPSVQECDASKADSSTEAGIQEMDTEWNRPILIKSGDTRLLINGQPPLVDVRVVAEEHYQKLKEGQQNAGEEAVALKKLRKWVLFQKIYAQVGYVKAKSEENKTMYSSENMTYSLVLEQIDKLLTRKQ